MRKLWFRVIKVGVGVAVLGGVGVAAYPSIQALQQKVGKVMVPLGVT
ncbi:MULTISPECIES: hypothetical protein [Stenotrophomonas]|jgi:hypothetical protein|nr:MULTISPECIES: hypothetical protein [Stenotrophomonas]